MLSGNPGSLCWLPILAMLAVLYKLAGYFAQLCWLSCSLAELVVLFSVAMLAKIDGYAGHAAYTVWLVFLPVLSMLAG